MLNQKSRFFPRKWLCEGKSTSLLAPLTLTLSPQTLGGEGTVMGTFLIW